MDANGSVDKTYSYDAFGTTTQSGGSQVNSNLRFASGHHEPPPQPLPVRHPLRRPHHRALDATGSDRRINRKYGRERTGHWSRCANGAIGGGLSNLSWQGISQFGTEAIRFNPWSFGYSITFACALNATSR